MNEKTNSGLDSMTHFYCELCNDIQPTFFEGKEYISSDGKFIGGDIVCKECFFIIATAYVKK